MYMIQFCDVVLLFLCCDYLRPHCNFSFEIIKFTLPYLTLPYLTYVRGMLTLYGVLELVGLLKSLCIALQKSLAHSLDQMKQGNKANKAKQTLGCFVGQCLSIMTVGPL